MTLMILITCWPGDLKSIEFAGSLNRWKVPYNPPIGSIYHLYNIPLIYCLLGDYISPIPPIKGTRNSY